MSNEAQKKQGIELDQIHLDAHGEIDGLDDDMLDAIAGGLMDCPTNKSCGGGQSNSVCT